MTIQQANQYFAALPDGFADPAQLVRCCPPRCSRCSSWVWQALPVKRRWRVC